MKVNFLHPLTNIPSPSYQIHSSYHFPHDGHDNKLPIGKTVTILCHLTNSGPSAFVSVFHFHIMLFMLISDVVLLFFKI